MTGDLTDDAIAVHTEHGEVPERPGGKCRARGWRRDDHDNRRQAKRLNIEDDFKQRVQDVVQPGKSAILVIVRKATPDKVEEALRPYGGTVLRSSLTRDSEQQLMKALHGDDPKAPTWEQPTTSGTSAS